MAVGARGRRGARLGRGRAAGGGAATRSSDRLAADRECVSDGDFRRRGGLCGVCRAGAARRSPWPEWAVLWDQSAWPLLFAVLIAIAFVFPDGRLPSPRWRRVAFAATASVAAFLVLSFFDSEPFESPYEDVDRPLPGLPGVFGVLWPLAFLGMLAGLLAGAQAVRVRFRRATGIERLQLKWLAYTAVLVPATLLVCVAGALATGNGDDGAVFTALFFFMLGAIPTSVGVAVLRYRLYDIDRVINRTLVYGVLTLLLAGAYAATTLLLGTGLGSGSAWPTAVATLLVAVAFRPLRARVQDAVDRRFSRARYDARTRIVGLPRGPARRTRRARGGRAAAPRGARPTPGSSCASSCPRASSTSMRVAGPPATRPEDGRVRTPVTRAGLPLGMRAPQPRRRGAAGIARGGRRGRRPRDRDRTAARRAAPPARRGRGLARANRVRRYEERRRLERDLHDGAQQRLISIGLALRHAQHELGVSPEKAGESIDGAVEGDRRRDRRAPGARPRSPAGAARRRAHAGSQGACRPRPAARPGQGERRALSAGARGRGLLHRERGADQRRQAFSGPAGHVERGAPERNARDLDLRRRDRRRRTKRGQRAARAGGPGRGPRRHARDRERAETAAPSSPWSCRASSDRGGPGAPAGGPGAPLRGRRA